MITQPITSFPGFQAQVEDLVNDHLDIADEPVLLAIYYAPVWLKQAKSDLDAARRVLISSDTTTYCHAIAKFQQTVEKSIEGLVAALRDAKYTQNDPTTRHGLEEELKLLTLLIRMPKSKVSSDIASKISMRLHIKNRGEVRNLAQLAPKKEGRDELAPLNTEYPYHKEGWILEDSFGH